MFRVPSKDRRALGIAVVCVVLLVLIPSLSGTARSVALGAFVFVALAAILAFPRRPSLHDRVDEIAESVTRDTAPGAGGITPVAELERLADLRDRGALTDDEFREQKRKLLADLPPD